LKALLETHDTASLVGVTIRSQRDVGRITVQLGLGHGGRDAMNLWEIATVNRHNEALAAEYANQRR